jgi:hypothetical protein
MTTNMSCRGTELLKDILAAVSLSSGVARFIRGGEARGECSHCPLLIATISFKKSQQFIDFSFVC